MPTPNSLSREKKEAQRVELLDLICQAFQLPTKTSNNNKRNTKDGLSSKNSVALASKQASATLLPTSNAAIQHSNGNPKEDFMYNKVESILEQTDTSDEAILVLELLHNQKRKEQASAQNNQSSFTFSNSKNNTGNDDIDDDGNGIEDGSNNYYYDTSSSIADALQKLVRDSERTDKDYLDKIDEDEDEDDEEEEDEKDDNGERDIAGSNNSISSEDAKRRKREKESQRRMELLSQIPGGAAAAFLRNAMNLDGVHHHEDDASVLRANADDTEQDRQRKLDEIIVRYRGGIGGGVDGKK